MFDINRALEDIKKVYSKYTGEIYLFGSRARQDYTTYSDYDICVFLDSCTDKIDARNITLEHHLQAKFEERFNIFCFVKQDGKCLPPNFAIKLLCTL